VTKGKYSLGDFDMLRTLGTGSFGRVHLVQSKHNQRFYAIKVLKKAQVVKMKQVEHTNDERRMLGEVKHPFLITLWGTFQDPRNLYMVMDFVEGGELFSLLRKSGVSLLCLYFRGRSVKKALTRISVSRTLSPNSMPQR
jgi:protein kinase A